VSPEACYIGRGRMAVLRAIVTGTMPEVQRNRLKWFIDHRILAIVQRTSPHERTVRILQAGWDALGVAADDACFTVHLQLAGYRSDKTMRLGRK